MDTTTTAKQGRRRASNLLTLSRPALVEEPIDDPELTAAWRAYCARVGRDPSEPPWSEDEMRAALGPDVAWI